MLALLLILRFMVVQRTLYFTATGCEAADFRFRIGVKRHRQMRADEAAEGLMRTLGLLHVE
ncbi:hypothetical protein D3C80_1717700 [compost metagenome]